MKTIILKEVKLRVSSILHIWPTVLKPDTMALMGIDSVCVSVTPFGLHFARILIRIFCTAHSHRKDSFEGAARYAHLSTCRWTATKLGCGWPLYEFCTFCDYFFSLGRASIILLARQIVAFPSHLLFSSLEKIQSKHYKRKQVG